jgi:hypothetical protein
LGRIPGRHYDRTPAELLRRFRSVFLKGIPQAWEIWRSPLRHHISDMDLVRARR